MEFPSPCLHKTRKLLDQMIANLNSTPCPLKRLKNVPSLETTQNTPKSNSQLKRKFPFEKEQPVTPSNHLQSSPISFLSPLVLSEKLDTQDQMAANFPITPCNRIDSNIFI